MPSHPKTLTPQQASLANWVALPPFMSFVFYGIILSQVNEKEPITSKWICSGAYRSSLDGIILKPGPIALEASLFCKLLLELIFLIASYLPIELAALLGLSCYFLHSHLKIECLQPLKEAEYSVMNGFLGFLE